MQVAYKSERLLEVVREPAETRKPRKTETAKSIFTVQRENRFRRAALKKYAARIAAIQKYYPGWVPIFK
jgi:hypothetical protein